MSAQTESGNVPFEVFGPSKIDRIPQLSRLPETERVAMKAVASVLPFRVNRYVLDELIDWSAVPDDPIFRLTFPNRGMLAQDDFDEMYGLVSRGASPEAVGAAARTIQRRLNPHPAGQVELNSTAVPGIQHKYRETVLLFPNQGQTCHAYCTYCFRWAQFVGLDGLKFSSREPERLADYVRGHQNLQSVLFSGGDPMVMRTKVLRRYVEPLLAIEHVRSIRFGTKAVAYWPHRFVHGSDADDLMRLFEDIRAAGKHVAVMGHYSHPQELSTPVARQAIERITSTGALVRTQAPLVRHVNDQADIWSELWRTQVGLGAVPYYFFIERDTGPRHYFEVPLARALEIFTEAYGHLSGLGRTVRGPSMSCTPGKVLVDGVAEVAGQKVFVLKMLQARNPEWANRIFFAEFDAEATWMDHLRPAFGASAFFFEQGRRPVQRVQEPLAARRHLELFQGADAE